MSLIDIPLTTSQHRILTAKERFKAFIGGAGSGKTFCGGSFAISQSLQFQQAPGIITAPTYSQLHTATIPIFLEVCGMAGLPITQDHINEKKKFIHFLNTRIHFSSMEEPSFLRGPKFGFAWIDESPYCKDASQIALIGRIRHMKGSGQILHTGTPRGTSGYVYEKFKKNPTGKTFLIQTHPKENARNLPEWYVSDLTEDYDPKMVKQELEGEFIEVDSDLVYPQFNKGLHVINISNKPIANEHIYIALDFNVDPLCGVIAHNNPMTGELTVFDEIFLKATPKCHATTFELRDYILKMFDKSMLSIIPDSTFDKRQTNAINTDKEILKEAGFEIVSFKNPFIKDRFNCVKNMLLKEKLKINSSCTHLIEDLENLCYNNNNKMLSHISAALGYLCWHLYPIRKPMEYPKIRTYYA